MKRVAIVGGGITGLAAAYELERISGMAIDLYEGSPRLGGKLRTDVVGDLTVEAGPDCFFSRKPEAMAMVAELGIEDQIVAPKAKEFRMLVGGTLHRVPAGLVTLNAVRPKAVECADFLSDEAKARVLREAEQPVGEDSDESIRSFFTRRFGAEFTRLVAEPLLAGTHSGDPDRLSMRALFPAYLDWERGGEPHRITLTLPSILEATPNDSSRRSLASPPSADPPSGEGEATPKPTFLSFRGGMQTLVDALARSLTRSRVHLGTKLDDLPEADHVLLAIPANRAAGLLPGIGLERIGHHSSSIVTFAFRRTDVGHDLEGTGFLVPPSEPFPLTGATWSSAKWPDRAPEDTVLLRVFMRGEGDARTALDALKPLLGIVGEPLFSRVDRWKDAQPQYEVGHLDLVAAIEARLPQGVSVAGTSYRGVGIPDCLRQGRDAARRIAEAL